MSNTFNGNKSSSHKKSAETEKMVLEAITEIIYNCTKSYYDYLSDMRSEGLDDNCDYCTAFMLA